MQYFVSEKITVESSTETNPYKIFSSLRVLVDIKIFFYNVYFYIFLSLNSWLLIYYDH